MAMAIVFAALLNLGLVSEFVWPELLGPAFRLGVWLFTACFWGVAVWRSLRRLSDTMQQFGSRFDDLFQQAQTEYLRGHWFEAESLLQQILSANQHDLDARLMLATLYRHTRRNDEAKQQLRHLQRFDGADHWQLEVAREHQHLTRFEEESAGQPQAVPIQQTQPPADMSEAA
jgi:thioredoxin-like negative regulator of GroEL